MNKEPKKRINIGVPLDMLEKIESINQDEYRGCFKVRNIMLTMIDLGFFAVDYFGGFKIACAGMHHEAKEQKAKSTIPAVIPSHGTVLEFPCGNRLDSSRSEEDRK